MKISYNWLKEYLPIDLKAEEAADLLTHCGLEVEGIESFESMPGGLAGLVVGEVVTCTKHPNADKLSLTTVNVGEEKHLHIVCGAPNVAVGQKVIVARVGSTLYPVTGEPFEIRQSKIRGELSEGMICAEDEIGLGTSHEGVIVLDASTPVGLPAAEYFKVERDQVLEIGLTPNRADAASHIGVARDLYAVLRAADRSVKEITYPDVPEALIAEDKTEVKINVENSYACPRYSGLTMTGVKVGDSPAWLQNRLKSIGLSPINNIVDATNFVLHECGQPLHAFDLDKIKDKSIIVRNAKPGEKFITLDNVERKLFSEDLMICDAEKPMCIAGIFGGAGSGITNSTSNIFIESACFNPASIRKSSKLHGLKTDASFRFERGSDPEITIYALKRVAQLIQKIAGGKIASEITDIYPDKIKASEFSFDLDYLNKFSGDVLDAKKVKDILISLGIKILKEEGQLLQLQIPSYKVDVTRAVDVVEEVLRIYGYNKIPVPSKMNSSLPAIVGNEKESLREKTSGFLASCGFIEIMTNSLGKFDPPGTFEDEKNAVVKLLNPLSQDLDSLRQNVLSAGLEVIEYNRNRKNPDLRLFEFATTYAKSSDKFTEAAHLALYMTGRKFDISWNGDKSPVSFYLLKSFVENILERCKIDKSSLLSELFTDHQLSTGMLLKTREKNLVRFGSVRKSVLKSYDISNEVFFADFNWDALMKSSRKAAVQVREVSKFPSVRRDLSMMIDSNVLYSQIEAVAFKTERKLLKAMNLFDVYQGDKIESGKKSYAVSFILLDEQQTLTDKHIDKTMDRLMAALEKEVGAVIRKA